MGWYGEHAEPGLYREVRPAWSDENLRYLCRHIRSHLYFAHVRASTGTPITRPNCHPFACGRWLFMHNGLIGNWSRLRRKVEGADPRRGLRLAHRHHRFGGGVSRHPRRRRRQGPGRSDRAGDGHAHRHGHHQRPQGAAALHGRACQRPATSTPSATPPTTTPIRSITGSPGGNVVVVSEPLDTERAHWKPVPPGHAIVAQGRQAGPAAAVPRRRSASRRSRG